MQSALILFPVIPSFQPLIQVYDNDYAVIIKKTPARPIAGSGRASFYSAESCMRYRQKRGQEPEFVAASVYRANLTAYLIADDMDERGL
jgi:hypothetical protein